METKENIVENLTPENTPDFKSIELTTHTVMAYTNCNFNLENIKKNLKVNIVENLSDPGKKQGELYIANNDLGKANRFRNQIHVRVYVIDKCVAVKIFKTGKLHMTGCKTMDHAFQAATELVKKFKTSDGISEPESDKITITFEPVMINLGFDLDFIIDRSKFDSMVQRANMPDMYSTYDPMTCTSVNLKMRYDEPEQKSYPQIILDANNRIKKKFVDTSPKSKPKNERKHTFLVFGGSIKGKNMNHSKVIQSGRYYDTHMEAAFHKFLEFVYKNRDNIEMKSEVKPFNPADLEGLSPIEESPIQTIVI